MAGNWADYYLADPSDLPLVDSIVERTRAELIRLIRDSLDYRPDIHVVGEPWEFERLLGGAFPDWGAAAANPVRQLIVIKSPDRFNVNKSLPELLAHEYAHLALHDRTGFNSPPRWFDEGLAMLVSTEWGWSENLTMSKAAVFGNFIPLEEIRLLNRFKAPKASVAYAQSYMTVKYLFDEYGVDAVNIFLDRIREAPAVSGHRLPGQPTVLDSALIAATGSDLAGFEQEVRVYLTQRFNLASLLVDTMFLWVLLAVVIIIGGILAIKRRRDYYRKWEEEEQLHSTDFDYGDPDFPERTDDDDDEPWRR
ncbi:hypothetical protein GF420_02335 [candidate division GN15 bacterium]|nr:hypothetical protein [candidate division GN15 bacterium]